MAEIVQVDYEQLGAIAARFQAQAQATEALRGRVENALSLLRDAGWIGLGADAFFAEVDGKVMPGVQRLQEALQEAAAVTHQIVEVFNGADEEASAPFRRPEDGTETTGPGLGSGGSESGAGQPGGGGGTGDVSLPPGETPIVAPPTGTVGVDPSDNDFGIPQDWLADVTDGLPRGEGELDSDWLNEVRDNFGLTDGSGGGAGGSGDFASSSEMGSGLSAGGASGGGASGGGVPSSLGSGAGGGPSGGASGGGSGSGGGVPGGVPSGLGSGLPGGGSSAYQTPQEAGFATGIDDFAGAGGAGASFVAGEGAGGGLGEAQSSGSLLDRMGAAASQAAQRASLGSLSVPIGIAATSPFLALLGKTLKEKGED